MTYNINTCNWPALAAAHRRLNQVCSDLASLREDLKRATAPRWKTNDETFAKLMLGRIEIAQITKSSSTDNWFYALKFCINGEHAIGSEPTRALAEAVAEAHARKVLA